MRSFVFGYITIAITLATSIGCVTSQKTAGFQTNPDVNSQMNQPIGVASNEKKSVIKKIFSSFAGNKDPKTLSAPRIDPNDATSLQNRPDISPELLVVAGKLSLEKHAWESAESYFTRALKMDPSNALAKEGLHQVARARALGLPTNQNTDPNPNNQIKTGAELNQALRNLMPNGKPDHNSFGSNSTSSKPRSMVGLNSADGSRNLMANYPVPQKNEPQQNYPSTQTPSPFETSPFLGTKPAINFEARTDSSRGSKVVNPFYQRNNIMTVAYEEPVQTKEPNRIVESTEEKSVPQKIAAKPLGHSSGKKISSELQKFKASLSNLIRVKSPTQNGVDQDVLHEDFTPYASVVAGTPDKLEIENSNVKPIGNATQSLRPNSKGKVIRAIADDRSTPRGK